MKRMCLLWLVFIAVISFCQKVHAEEVFTGDFVYTPEDVFGDDYREQEEYMTKGTTCIKSLKKVDGSDVGFGFMRSAIITIAFSFGNDSTCIATGEIRERVDSIRLQVKKDGKLYYFNTKRTPNLIFDSKIKEVIGAVIGNENLYDKDLLYISAAQNQKVFPVIQIDDSRRNAKKEYIGTGWVGVVSYEKIELGKSPLLYYLGRYDKKESKYRLSDPKVTWRDIASFAMNKDKPNRESLSLEESCTIVVEGLPQPRNAPQETKNSYDETIGYVINICILDDRSIGKDGIYILMGAGNYNRGFYGPFLDK